MFEVVYNNGGLYHPKVTVYDVGINSNDDPIFLVHMSDVWEWKLAKYFVPVKR